MSEAQFKTLKYCPTYPGYFANIQQARDYCRRFFRWYNEQHRHTGIGLLTPHDVHHGHADERRIARRAVLATAWGHHPERFVRGQPEPPMLPAVAYINQPEITAA